MVSVSNEKVVYYESIKGELKTRPIYECRYDERLETKVEESTHLAYTGLYCPSFYRIEMLALLNDMIIVDRYLWG